MSSTVSLKNLPAFDPRLLPVLDRPLKEGRTVFVLTEELYASLLSKLREGLQALGLPAEPQQEQKLIHSLEFLSRWNAVINLTAVREPEAMLVQHLLDCLAVIPHLPEEATSLLDVGSGGGFPALPIAIMRPELEVVAIDAVRKKTDYLNRAAEALRIPNLIAVHGRVEEHPMTYDWVISRAYASLADFVRTAAGCLNVEEDARMLAMKGKRPLEEIEELSKIGWRIESEHALTVPFLEAERCLLELKPVRRQR